MSFRRLSQSSSVNEFQVTNGWLDRVWTQNPIFVQALSNPQPITYLDTTVGIGYCDYHLVTLVIVLIGYCVYFSNSQKPISIL